jgi:DNA polymerase III alpha subunit (gram-positive type)
LEKKLKEVMNDTTLKEELRKKNEEILRKNSEIKAYVEEIETLKEKISTGKLNEMKVQYERQMKNYEELLGNMERELNERERQIEAHQARIKNLEKRQKHQQRLEKPTLEEESEVKVKQELSITAYFDYSVIFNEEKNCVIHGNFHLFNSGLKRLQNPLVCFRFYPEETSVLKGKILSLEHTDKISETESNKSWMFLDNDWANEAKERGEVWITPVSELSIDPNETISISDLQIPVKRELLDRIAVEGFIFFQKQDYKVKAANHIALNF